MESKSVFTLLTIVLVATLHSCAAKQGIERNAKSKKTRLVFVEVCTAYDLPFKHTRFAELCEELRTVEDKFEQLSS